MELGQKLNWKTLWMYVLAILFAGSLHAQDITGNWQGEIIIPQGRPLRVILQATRDDSGALTAKLYTIGQDPGGVRVESITVQGSAVKFVLRAGEASYEGKLNADDNSITGTWIQGSRFPLNFQKATKATAWPTDPSPHTVQFITVETGVKLEVLDWGGTGRPIVFLAGLGDSAHGFDNFAPKFTGKYHVYGITRRGFGNSSAVTPDAHNYSSDRLGDDVLAVIDALKLQKPVLAGHSIAGEELSSIGSRHPEKVSGLIYLDAGFPYAFYDRVHGDPQLDMLDTRHRIEQLLPNNGFPAGQEQRIEGLLASLPQLEKDLQNQLKLLQAVPSPTTNAPLTPSANAASAIFSGEHKYTEIKAPCLAIFAVPHNPNSGALLPTDAAHHAAAVAADLERGTNLANAFEAGVPSAQVIRLPNADHYVFNSNEAEVFRAMNDFLDKLPQP
ncbi:MAG TPA: alpha/beta hydrolase [Granulicella sp.]|jgi:pimeloyl-ACP methyl ester carboxylesterase